MYRKDLTKYVVGTSLELPEVMSVGWLDKRYPYNHAGVGEKMLTKLRELIFSFGDLDIHVNPMRGTHQCDFCDEEDIFLDQNENGKRILLGMDELWIPSLKEGEYFASPSLIYHYMDKHAYCPSPDYIASVLALDLETKFHGQEVYNRLVRKY
jgi:hypothetical protein